MFISNKYLSFEENSYFKFNQRAKNLMKYLNFDLDLYNQKFLTTTKILEMNPFGYIILLYNRHLYFHHHLPIYKISKDSLNLLFK